MRATLHGLYSEVYTDEENVRTLIDDIMKDMNYPATVREKLNPITKDGNINEEPYTGAQIKGGSIGDKNGGDSKNTKQGKNYAKTGQQILTYIKRAHLDSSNAKKFLELTKGWTPDERKALRAYFDEHIAPGSHSKKKHPQNGKLKDWLEWDMSGEYLKSSKVRFGIN